MKLFLALARASHFAPTILVSTVAGAFTAKVWQLNLALPIALTVFVGQLSIGWSNDAIDADSDILQDRKEKPVVAQAITASTLTRLSILAAIVSLPINLLGPLGLKAGALHLLAIGSGVSYNFFFKNIVFSPLPFALSFGLLPSFILVGAQIKPPLWVFLWAALLGITAHFANCLKDIDADVKVGIKGLPQRLGKKTSRYITIAGLLLSGIVVLAPAGLMLLALANLPFALILLRVNLAKFFPVLMLIALVNISGTIYFF